MGVTSGMPIPSASSALVLMTSEEAKSLGPLHPQLGQTCVLSERVILIREPHFGHSCVEYLGSTPTVRLPAITATWVSLWVNPDHAAS